MFPGLACHFWQAALAAVLCLTLTGCRDLAGHAADQHSPALATPLAADSRVRLVDTAVAAGLNYHWTIAGARPLTILQTIGNGCAFLDYDGDGNLDVLLVGPRLALYRGDGHGHFTDVTRQTGLDKLTGHFLGCAVGDYDNDGYDDLYISGYRTGLLLHNEGGKRFQDVTRQAGLSAEPWGTSCAWADLDGDGQLDLIIGNYAHFGPETQPQLCKYAGLMSACGPRFYTPESSVIYHNLGRGKFRPLPSPIKAPDVAGKTLGVAVADYDGSGLPGVALANDEVAGDLFQNRHGKLANIGAESGTAYDSDGNVHGGMGVDWGDYNNDGRMDLALATFQHEGKCIYQNLGGGLFEDHSTDLGVAALTVPNVAFGVKWLDIDNDGWLDLILANGHVQDNIGDIDRTATYREPTQLFHNEGGKRFTELTNEAGSDLQKPIVGRGLAVGDYDNDGKVDVLVVDSEGAPMLLHNETSKAGHWAGFRLRGTGKGNRDGYGAVLTLEAGGRTLTRQCQSCGSYLSSSDPRVHFGLGQSASITRLTVRWPDHQTQVFTKVPADHYLTLTEGKPL